jgi:hypothetical protein
MNKLIISAVVFAAFISPVAAKQEVSVTRTVWEISDFPELSAKVKLVCEGKSTLSDKLKDACKDNTKLPKVTKAGAFRNTGIGAELNTLIRQAGDTAKVEPTK